MKGPPEISALLRYVEQLSAHARPPGFGVCMWFHLPFATDLKTFALFFVTSISTSDPSGA